MITIELSKEEAEAVLGALHTRATWLMLDHKDAQLRLVLDVARRIDSAQLHVKEKLNPE